MWKPRFISLFVASQRAYYYGFSTSADHKWLLYNAGSFNLTQICPKMITPITSLNK